MFFKTSAKPNPENEKDIVMTDWPVSNKGWPTKEHFKEDDQKHKKRSGWRTRMTMKNFVYVLLLVAIIALLWMFYKKLDKQESSPANVANVANVAK
jgi:hypothetical protein